MDDFEIDEEAVEDTPSPDIPDADHIWCTTKTLEDTPLSTTEVKWELVDLLAKFPVPPGSEREPSERSKLRRIQRAEFEPQNHTELEIQDLKPEKPDSEQASAEKQPEELPDPLTEQEYELFRLVKAIKKDYKRWLFRSNTEGEHDDQLKEDLVAKVGDIRAKIKCGKTSLSILC